MLSLKKKFLFIHIHKTGGNSIHTALLPYSDDHKEDLPHSKVSKDFEIKNAQFPTIRKHSSLKDYQQVLDKKIFDQLYKFACVRNPWERLISFYFSPHRNRQPWSREQFIEMMEVVPTSAEMLTTGEQPRTLNVDFVMRYENIKKDFSYVCEQIGLSNVELPHRNKSTNKRKHFLSYYDQALFELVAEKYAIDIELFNYKMDYTKVGSIEF